MEQTVPVSHGRPCGSGGQVGGVRKTITHFKSACAMQAAYRGLSRSEEHTSELQSLRHLVCRLLLEKKKTKKTAALCMASCVNGTMTTPTLSLARACEYIPQSLQTATILHQRNRLTDQADFDEENT